MMPYARVLRRTHTEKLPPQLPADRFNSDLYIVAVLEMWR
jgi:hypothetical protein